MLSFPVDTVIARNNICNLENELQQLFDLAIDSRRVVVFGRRNTGKTSLILNGLIPRLQSHHKKCCTVFVDFMGVETEHDAEIRLHRGIETALKQSFPLKQSIKTLLDIAGSLRPTISTDSMTGEISVSISPIPASREGTLSDLIQNLGRIHAKMPVFIAFDEFQDISEVPKLAALFRGALQQLPNDLPVFVCGSKKHLLASMFGRHKAPFAGWGRDFIIPAVESDHYKGKYLQYANDRLKAVGKIIHKQAFETLVTLCDGIPESLNIVLDHVYNHFPRGEVEEQEIPIAIVNVVEARRSRYEEMLLKFSRAEQSILVAIAKNGPISKPKGKYFLQQNANMSPTAVFSNVKRLERDADIYQAKDGYVISDPLLGVYLRRFR